MIEVKNLIKKYDNHVALDDLSFFVEKNQVFGFLGPNGAGKSTTMNIITGYLAPTSGSVIINGFDIVANPIEAKQCIGYLPEIPPVYMDMTPYEYLKFVAQAKKVDKTQIKDEIDRVMALTNISDVKNRLIKTLSKGYRQRVGMSQALLGNPQVIILDEPTVGLDPVQIMEFRDLIKELGKEHTVIISSHILSEISEICNKIMIISKGKLLAIDTPENLSNNLEQERSLLIKVKSTDSSVAADIISQIEGVLGVEINQGTDETATIEIRVNQNLPGLRQKISESLLDGRCAILAMEEREMTLEDIFIKLLGKQKEQNIDIKEEEKC